VAAEGGNGLAAEGHVGMAPAGVLGHALLRLVGLLSPLFWFSSLLGVLLSALAIVLDQPVTSLVDTALDTLLGVLHSLQLLPSRPASFALPPAARSLLMIPLRLPTVILATALLYMLTFPGYDLLVRARHGFEMGFRAVSRSAPSNAPSSTAAAEEADERLRAVLGTWNRLIVLVQAARLAAFSIAALAVVDRMTSRMQPTDV